MRTAVVVVVGSLSLAGAVLASKVKPRATSSEKATATALRRLATPSSRFDFPVGGGSARGYYNAQPFGENDHLGDDWNGVGGGDSDLGDPVLATASGVVVSASEAGRGWGKVVRVVHNAGTRDAPRWIESLYAHLETIEVSPRQKVRRGQRIGTIGTANGRYKAHLHFEIRSILDAPLGRGYSKKTAGYLDPTRFIRAARR